MKHINVNNGSVLSSVPVSFVLRRVKISAVKNVCKLPFNFIFLSLFSQELNMAAFEEQFKTKAQSAPVDVGTLKIKLAHKTPSKVSLMEPNRAKNLAITLRKEGMAASDICCVIETYVPEKSSK